MLTFAYYLLKVIICSGILYGYYLLGLRNKIFHRWNRFYLLAAIVLSLAAPLIKINIWQNADGPKTQVVQLLQVVNSSDEIVFEYSKGKGNYQIDASNLSFFIYIAVSVLLLTFLIRTFIKINKLKKKYRQIVVEGINFINTNANGTPFSFFNNIFWNDKIDINTSTGKQIFQHEVAHVQEKHSYDKVFMNIVLIFFWCNPFFWLIRKELNIIHEFIADQKALKDSDTEAFAAMILQATYPQQQFSITNNFFYSPLKRRLFMLTKNKNPKISYASRLLVLPLAAFVFFAFTLKMKTISSVNPYAGKKIIVVIDAGHGGDDNGVVVDNIKEKDLTLSIAKEIKEMNKNENINIILSREQDVSLNVKDRIKFADENKADLFISIHIDGEPNKNTNSGLTIFIPKNDNLYLKDSKILGSDIIESFKNNYQLQIANDLKQRDEGIWVLKANQCPSVLVEAGFLSTAKDVDFLIKPENQQTIARNILDGIEKYAQKTTSIKSEASTNTIERDTIQNNPVYANIKQADSTSAIYIINGQIQDKEKLKGKIIETKGGARMYGPNNKEAIELYGEVAKNGVMVFTDAVITDKLPVLKTDTIPKYDKIFTQVENEAQFSGGQQAWLRYIQTIIQKNADLLLKDNNQGTCLLQFIVDVKGNVSDVKAITMLNSKLAEVAINAIKKGPKWIPAIQNGHMVTSYKKQLITFKIADNIVDNKEPK
jgi:N-acetylmuramoyl-L-alanine amidase